MTIPATIKKNKMSFDETVDNLKLKPIYWYSDNIPDEFKDIATDLYRVHNFFLSKNSIFQEQVDNHVLNLLILLRNNLVKTVENA